MLLSLISPQKNNEKFISQFEAGIRWIKDLPDFVELIIVDDHSTDKTFSALKEKFKTYKNVRVVSNIHSGKVSAINHGFSLVEGEYVRIIDGDDILLKSSYDVVTRMGLSTADVASSSYSIKVGKFSFKTRSRFFKQNPFDERFFYSPPRWNWTFRKKFADKFFPIPSDLPFEDLYLAISIVKNAAIFIADSAIDYVYVQHGNQTYGGIHRISKDLLLFRAKRNLDVLQYLKSIYDFHEALDVLFGNTYSILEGKLTFKQKLYFNPSIFGTAYFSKMLIDHLMSYILIMFNIKKYVRNA